MTPTEQYKELREQVSTAMYDTDYKHVTEESDYFDKAAVDAVVELIQAHTNAEIAKVLDRLEAHWTPALVPDGEHPDGKSESEVVPLFAIQAEQAKLKERDDE